MGENDTPKLTKVERLLLVNQFRILEKLYPEEASSIAQHRKALEEGYELHYRWLFEGIYDDFPAEDSRFVLDVLAMYQAMQQAFPGDFPPDLARDLKFPGFDGNNETEYLGYARYFIDDLGRYEQLKGTGPFADLNSHMPMIGRYRRMLDAWHASKDRFSLSPEDVRRIVRA